MEYSQHFYSQHEDPMAAFFPQYHFPAPQPGHQDSYHPGLETVHNPNIVNPHLMQRAAIPSLEEAAAAEAEDTATRPRLTQEQIAVLEDNFKGKPKPGTDFKKQLAAQIGLSLQRNWYQNRRAKARHQRPQERRFDVLPADGCGPWSPADFAMNFKNTVLDISPDLSPQPLHAPTADYISIPRSDEPVDSSANFNAELDVFQSFLTSTQNMERSSNNTLQQSMYLQDANSLSAEKTSAAAMLDWKMSDWSPEMQAGAPFREDGFASLQHSAFPHGMYPGSVEDFPLANLSCQTFATSSSSDSEQPRLMTPPPRTSPLPFIPQDQLSRRESVTANIATGLNTIHLQQSQSNMDLGSDTFDLHTASASHTPEGTPPAPAELLLNTNYHSADLQQPTGSAEHQVPRLDLAARRKRPRPAALRPDAHRSQSYAGPLTQSPTARMPSLNVAKLNSVRRIKSTGNGLNVANGRVQKPSLSPSPLSPHNFQCLSSEDFLMQNAQVTQGPLTPLSPPTVEQPAHSWPEQWSIGREHPTPTEYSAEARVTSPPVTPYNHVFPHPFADGASQSWPPSSAPPQQTTFFDSPPLPSNHFGHLSWQVPSSMPIPSYPEDVSNTAHPASVPQYGYVDQHLAGQQYAYQQAGYCHQPPFVESSPPQKEIEIQVQVIPAPEGIPQGKKTYTFNHTTPKDFSSQDGGIPFKVAGTTDPNPV